MYKKKWAFRILIIGFLLNSSVTLAEHFSGHVDVKVGALSASAQKGN